MPKTPNLFFGDRTDQLDIWGGEFKSLMSNSDFSEKRNAISRFCRDCAQLATDMRKARDPNLTDTVDLNRRYDVLENTRRSLLNVVQTEETPI